jgi:hypothetical protein
MIENQFKPITKQELKDRILKEKGISIHRRKGKHKELIKPVLTTACEELKTPTMKLVELKTHMTIEKLLSKGSLSDIVKIVEKKGIKLDPSTISKWKLKLGLHYSNINLPKCYGCYNKVDSCKTGNCNILIQTGLFQLLEAKRRDMIINGDIN